MVVATFLSILDMCKNKEKYFSKVSFRKEKEVK